MILRKLLRDEMTYLLLSLSLTRIITLLTVTRSHTSIASWDAPSPSPELPVDRVVSIQHLSGSGTTCLVLEGGDIITVQEDQFSDNGAHVEIMGSIDAGISAARWSPDEELLLVTTKANTVIFMGATFDPVAEVTMTADDLKASKHVSVGWGKKETQFQGRGAKALRDPTIPEKVDQGLPSAHEDGATSISWRGDGAYVAINSVQEGSRRVVRVYSREGELDSASEPVDGLEGALSWRPSGNLMAGIQRLTDRVDVVFFERNGLRHGQFTLRSPGSSVLSHEKISLEWNSDSTVLAVILEDSVQLWTMGNYHWYLKQEIPITAGFSCLAWHPEKALRFASASSSETVIVEEAFYTARGSCLPPHDIGAVAVIDGETVKLTPFRTANVPPPMSLFDIAAESSVVDVAFGRQNSLFAVLHRKGVDVYEWPIKNGRAIKPSLKSKIPFSSAGISDGQVPLRIVSTAEGHFRCFVSPGDSDVVHFAIDANGGTMDIIDSQDAIVSTSTYEDENSLEAYGQDMSGNLYKLSETATDLLPIQFPVHLPWFEIVKFDGEITAFGLSRNGHIYANSRMLAKNCTSFVLTPSHLIFTTSNHFVKYVHLVPNVEGTYIPCPCMNLTNTT